MGLEQINILRKERGMDLETLSEKSGVPYGTLSKISAGITKDPKLETVKAIARALGVTIDVFDTSSIEATTSQFTLSSFEKIIIKKYRELDTHGKEIIQLILDHELERCESTFEKRMGSVVKENKSLYAKVIPLSGKVSAGQGVEAVEEYDTITGPDKADFALIVDGDSMEPRFHDSQIIYIRSQPQLENGQIGVVQVMVEEDFIPRVYLKKIKKHGNQIELVSLNSAYEPMLFSSNEVHILGSVLN